MLEMRLLGMVEAPPSFHGATDATWWEKGNKRGGGRRERKAKKTQVRLYVKRKRV